MVDVPAKNATLNASSSLPIEESCMARPFEPTSEHATAGVDAGGLSSHFLEDLRTGERDAFLRFFDA